MPQVLAQEFADGDEAFVHDLRLLFSLIEKVDRIDDRVVIPFAIGITTDDRRRLSRAEKKAMMNDDGALSGIGSYEQPNYLSREGPASWGYAAFDFQDVMFVDVGGLLHNGERCLIRTLVIEEEKGKWRAHPLPGSSPLLSVGLNEEAESTVDFKDVYSVKKTKS